MTARADGPAVHFPHPAAVHGQARNVPAGTKVVLEARPFPYTAGFAATGPPAPLGASGGFRLTAPLSIATEYRVSTVDPPASSAPMRVEVIPVITTRVNTVHPKRGRRVRFTGTVGPPVAGAPFALQKLTAHGWVTVAGGTTRAAAGGLAAYGKTIRVRRGGDYRVFVRMGDGIRPGAGRVEQIRPR